MIVFVLQTQKLRYGNVSRLTQGHIAFQQQILDEETDLSGHIWLTVLPCSKMYLKFPKHLKKNLREGVISVFATLKQTSSQATKPRVYMYH